MYTYKLFFSIELFFKDKLCSFLQYMNIQGSWICPRLIFVIIYSFQKHKYMRAKICISVQEIKLFEWHELNMLVKHFVVSARRSDERKEVLRDHFPTMNRKFSLVHSSSPSLIDINFENRIAQNRDTSWAGVNLVRLWNSQETIVDQRNRLFLKLLCLLSKTILLQTNTWNS